MYDSVRSKGVMTALVEFEGEQHGFLKASSIRTALDGELQFYGRVFGFQPYFGGGVDGVELPIVNAPEEASQA